MRTPYSNSDEMSISLIDVVHFFQRHYRTIFSIGLAGLVCAIAATFVLGDYTATVSLQNLSGIDIPNLKYLQSALPKLEQENQDKQKDRESAYLGSERFWEKNVKPIILVSKADGKDLLDQSSLKSAGSNIASLQFIAKGRSEAVAESRIEEITKTFINGAAYIGLRDLLRGYELKVITANSNLNKKIGSAEVELVYVDRRIKNLMELKNQYPSVAMAPLQVIDAKDSGAKYLPISTQLVAATTDANSLREALSRYQDEEKQLPIYTQFIEKAKPLIDNGRKDGNLVDSLLEVANQIEKNTQEAVQKIALEDIRVALTSIQTNKAFGLRQAGIVDVKLPPYLQNSAIGLLAGLFFGLLLAMGLTLVNQYKSTLSTASKVSPISN
jgi:hypothetical protein